MRVLILSQYYDPEPIPKPSELAGELKRRGHDVFVVTGFPNYPSGVLYPGFRLALLRREKINGVPVLRTFEFPYHGKSSLGRILNYISFMFSSLLGAFLTPACDVIYAWHPPLTVGVAAVFISLVKRVPFVYDVQDIWPESIVLAGWNLSPFMIRVMHWMELFVYRYADRILVVTEGAKKNLVAKGVPAEKVVVASHWVDEALFLQERGEVHDVRAQYGIGTRFMVMFAGNMGLMQGMDTIIYAAEKLRQHKEIIFALVGNGVDLERLQSMVSALQLSNVLFIERQPMSEMPHFLSSADALVIPLRDSHLSDCIIPTKTFAYLAAGRPILAAANGACADLVRKANAGLVVSPDSPEAVASAVLHLYKTPVSSREQMGRNGRSYLLSHFSKERVVSKYEQILIMASQRQQ